MSENVNFYQGSKENYNPSEMQGGLYFSKDSKEILLNGESYGNATPADEEDITAESGNLKLRDREYDANNFSGKGYKILRKNIVEGKNVLTQDMVNETNTVYEIRYDFDLNEQTINITEGSVLIFNGGSISNGRIIFYKGVKVINDNFINCSFSLTNNDVIPFTKGLLFTSEENLKNTTDVRLKDIVYLKTNYGIKSYEINTSGGYLDEGAIELVNYDNVSAVPLKETVIKGVIDVTKYGIYPNGEDMSDKLNTFLSSDMLWHYNTSTLYFPGGTYKFSKPISFVQRCNIIGDPVSVYGNELTGTVFDFSDIVNENEGEELWCIVPSQQLYLVENIVFLSNSYSLVENRQNILLSLTDAWDETINLKNICGIKDALYINKCYFKGFSGTCIQTVWGISPIYFSENAIYVLI